MMQGEAVGRVLQQVMGSCRASLLRLRPRNLCLLSRSHLTSFSPPPTSAADPFDMVSIQMILSELRPDLLIETGTAGGGSALLWASIFELLGLHTSRCVGVGGCVGMGRGQAVGASMQYGVAAVAAAGQPLPGPAAGLAGGGATAWLPLLQPRAMRAEPTPGQTILLPAGYTPWTRSTPCTALARSRG